ncbi:nectin-1-like isoform X2 [Betta splendens]|uniref:Nectin-1-like isoform X2 n=1 Tax=Betta splendens TaxID=158456 RepID=A0A9W2XM68_BETSP|nr:nectin-1-like isoform X2 [Betta splendens]
MALVPSVLCIFPPSSLLQLSLGVFSVNPCLTCIIKECFSLLVVLFGSKQAFEDPFCGVPPKDVHLTSLIQTHQTVMGAVGEEVNFSCLLTESKDVLQVTWQKILPDVDKNVATYNTFGQRVDPDFRDKVKFKVTGLQNSSIVISSVTEQDEGCYLCLFNTYPEGAFKGRTCLQVCELHEPILHVRGSNSSEESLVSCSVTARPAPTVTLTVTQQHLYFSHYSTVTVTNANNTLTVTKTAVLSGLHGDGTQVGCAVRVPSGPQKEVFMNITEVKPKSADALSVVLSVMACSCVAAVGILMFLLKHKKESFTCDEKGGFHLENSF